MAGELTTLEELNTQIKDALDNKLTPSADIIKQFAQTIGTITLDSGEILKTLKYWQDENQASFDTFLNELRESSDTNYQRLLEMRVLATQTQEASNLALGAANYQGVFVVGSTNAVAGASYAYQNEIWFCLANTSDTPVRGNSAWKNGLDEKRVVALANDTVVDNVAYAFVGASLSGQEYLLIDRAYFVRGGFSGFSGVIKTIADIDQISKTVTLEDNSSFTAKLILREPIYRTTSDLQNGNPLNCRPDVSLWHELGLVIKTQQFDGDDNIGGGEYVVLSTSEKDGGAWSGYEGVSCFRHLESDFWFCLLNSADDIYSFGGHKNPNNASASVALTRVARFGDSTHNFQSRFDVTRTALLEGSIKTNTILNFNNLDAGIVCDTHDGFTIRNLNLRGKTQEGLLSIKGSGIISVSDIVSQNSSGPVLRLTDGTQDGHVDDVDILVCGDADLGQEAGSCLFVGDNVNNIDFKHFRVEAPLQTAMYFKNAQTLLFYGNGKIDGSGYGGLTLNPFVVLENSSVKFRDFNITGFQSYPLEIKGRSLLDFDGRINNGKSNAVFYGTELYNEIGILNGFLRGTLLSPKVRARGSIQMRSLNTSGNNINSVISFKSPDPMLKPNTGNDGRVNILSVTSLGNRVYQAALTEWTGSGYTTPSANDVYVGGILCNLSTGAPLAVITSQAGSLIRFTTFGSTFPANVCFVKYTKYDGVHLDIDIDVSGLETEFNLVEIKQSVTVTSTSYSSTTGLTTVQLDSSVTNDELVGLFLYNSSSDEYYYISGNSGSQLYLIHDRTSLSNGAYNVTLGNPKAGKGISVNWVNP